jgi:uncharacterized protein with PIN domain
LALPGLVRSVSEGTSPHWICDEMLGKLARYLRFLGYDVEYAQGLRDTEIRERARRDGRRLVTRDVLLARRTPGAILLHRLEVEGQLRELSRAFPGLSREVRFVHCSVCNGRLVEADRSLPVPPRGVPEDRWASGEPVYSCERCGQAYWEGGHTREIRETISRALGAPPGTETGSEEER